MLDSRGARSGAASGRRAFNSRRRSIAGAVLGLLVLGACTSSGDSLPKEGLKLQPLLDQQHSVAFNMTLVSEGKKIPVIVDTGSVYAFVEKSGAGKLPCENPPTFHWGAGSAEFCKKTVALQAVATDGSVVELDAALSMGDARFSDWLGPDAIVGLAANLNGENVGGLEPVINQLDPAALSFRFPNGSQNNGIVQFAPLPAEALFGVVPIPLVDPGTLGYGYTAQVSRVDFIADHQIKASILTESDGVYLQAGGSKSKIAEKNLAFFDTGATEPYVPINGDISLLSDKVSDAVIFPHGQVPYEEVRFTFDVGDGDHVVLSNNQIRSYGTGEPGLALPTIADFPAGMKQLTTVVGLGTLTGYDFQFSFEDGAAKEVRFIE